MIRTKKNTFFISGIGTDVGKTVVSAILSLAWGADYWKPVQTGAGIDSDKKSVERLTKGSVFTHPEVYSFPRPVSPDAASHSAGVEIDLDLITSKLPTENRPLIIEGAGGLLVPLNSRKLIIDLVEALDSSIILVSRNYLGSINHTLLSIEAIKARGLSFAGIIFVGDENTESQGSIESFSKERVLGRVPWFSEFSLKELKTVGADISYPEG